MAQQPQIQDVFLNQARKEKIPVTVYITNGFQFRGTVASFDNYTVVLLSEGKQHLIYKHAVSTVSPAKSLNLREDIGTASEPDNADNKPADKAGG